MRILFSTALFVTLTMPAAAQTHARHTATHDSAHAIVLSEADHLAMHQLLLGRWTGMAALHGAGHDTLHVGFENDSLHQQLMVRHHQGVAGFEIRGDTLRWKQEVSGAPCMAATAISSLLRAARAAASNQAQISGTITCGKTQSAFTLTKIGTR